MPHVTTPLRHFPTCLPENIQLLEEIGQGLIFKTRRFNSQPIFSIYIYNAVHATSFRLYIA